MRAETCVGEDAVTEFERSTTFIVDRSGRIAAWSDSAELLTGYASGDIVGRPLATLDATEERRDALSERDLIAALSADTHRVGWHSRRDGTRFLAETETIALRSSSGELCAYAVVMLKRDGDACVDDRTMPQKCVCAPRASDALQQTANAIYLHLQALRGLVSAAQRGCAPEPVLARLTILEFRLERFTSQFAALAATP